MKYPKLPHKLGVHLNCLTSISNQLYRKHSNGLSSSYLNPVPVSHNGWWCDRVSGGHLNIKIPFFQYKDPHDKDKTVSQPFYLYHENPHPRKDGLDIEMGSWLHSIFQLYIGTMWHSIQIHNPSQQAWWLPIYEFEEEKMKCVQHQTPTSKILCLQYIWQFVQGSN